MNTIKLSKGNDMTIMANDVPLRFVTDFSVTKNTNEYKIVEFLTDEEIAVIPLKNTYTIEITAMSDMDSAPLEKDGFTLTVRLGRDIHTYRYCRLKQRMRISKPSQYVTDKYTIIAKDMTMSGGDIGEQ